VTATVVIPPALRRYLETLVATLRESAPLEAVYLVGSAASGAFDDVRSDVDVVAVTEAELTEAERLSLVRAVEALPVPARKLELVVYSREGAAAPEPSWQINLNTGEHFTFDPHDESPHWFVIDRAIAEQHAVPLYGPRWHELFAPVERERVLEAIEQSLAWQEAEDPVGRSSVLNNVRAWHWLETGEWVSKPEAAAALREKLRSPLA
jgi:predicted nucleotidyltransferase